MPLVKRKQVVLISPPIDLDKLPEDTQVFLLKVTGEIFLDYESYSARMAYLLTKIFQCEFSGKSQLSYQEAVESEKSESRTVRERFPDELKGRVLNTVQFQLCGRLDGLIDLVYERYKDRFFVGEKVFVDIEGDKFYARISKVFPPPNIRALVNTPTEGEPVASTSTSVASNNVEEDYSSVTHKIGTNLNIKPDDAKKEDDPELYQYTVQLMDEQHTFEGSLTEKSASNMSRDRLMFSKSILKRYIRECVQRESPVGSPWVVKPVIAAVFGIVSSQSEEDQAKNQQDRESKLAKRRKTRDDHEPAHAAPAPKKRKTNDQEGVEKKVPLPAAKPIKYPIEDLELDPMSIHDGRILRRVNSELPTLPPKPIPNKNLLNIPKELFDDFLMIWNVLNVFSKPLSLSPFPIDDFASVLFHSDLEPRCLLLAEIHACLTNVIATDASRVLGTSGAAPVPIYVDDGVEEGQDDIAEVASTTTTVVKGEEVEEVKEEVKNEVKEEEEENGEDEDEVVEEEYWALIRKGISHSKRWDRMAKLKSAEGREGWERHMIGCLCQRGGPLHLPNFENILRHLFEGADLTAPNPPYVHATASSEVALASEGGEEGDQLDQLDNSSVANDGTGTGMDEDNSIDTSDPCTAYLSLELKDKINILKYLCTLVLGSKLVRLSIEESEGQLTEFRKQKADVNKERRALLEQKAIIDGKAKEEAELANPTVPVDPTATTNGTATDGTATNGHALPSSVVRDKSIDTESNNGGGGGALRPPGSDVGTVEAEVEVEEDEEEDQLDEDDGMDDEVVKDEEEEEEEEYLSEDNGGPSGEVTGGGAIGANGVLGARRAALEEKKIEKKAQELARSIELAKARSDAKAKSISKKQADKIRLELEEGLKQNSKKDDFVEREFRRYQGVARSRPLGKDRFCNRYWWFDGVGGMSLIGPNNSIMYGTGRLFIQGPTKEDWDTVCERVGGKEIMEEKRRKEDVDENATLQVDEWAFYEDEEQIDALQSWLNGKGIRELNLKNSLAKWKEYILAGSRKRQVDAMPPVVPEVDARRSSRSKGHTHLTGYLGYKNTIASK